MRRLIAPFTTLLLLALAPAAHAGWYAAETVDGPAEIETLGDVDVARDGSGGVVYLKRDGGVPQVFLSRLDEGAWQRPEKLSGGAPVSEAVVTATDGGRLAVAWVAGGARRRRRERPRHRHGHQRGRLRGLVGRRRRTRGAAGRHELDAAGEPAGRRPGPA